MEIETIVFAALGAQTQSAGGGGAAPVAPYALVFVGVDRRIRHRAVARVRSLERRHVGAARRAPACRQGVAEPSAEIAVVAFDPAASGAADAALAIARKLRARGCRLLLVGLGAGAPRDMLEARPPELPAIRFPSADTSACATVIAVLLLAMASEGFVGVDAGDVVSVLDGPGRCRAFQGRMAPVADEAFVPARLGDVETLVARGPLACARFLAVIVPRTATPMAVLDGAIAGLGMGGGTAVVAGFTTATAAPWLEWVIVRRDPHATGDP